jgi:hypothetical protein
MRAKIRPSSKPLQICVFDAGGNVIDTHEDAGDFKEP